MLEIAGRRGKNEAMSSAARTGPGPESVTSTAVDDARSQSSQLAARLNWLRAAVLGANDGIVSVAATVVGVAAATTDVRPVLIAGVAAVIAGALSMAVGEYVSVSSASDSQRSIIDRLRGSLRQDPAREHAALRTALQQQGLSAATAEAVATELGQRSGLSAHLRTRWHLDVDEVLNPWHAAYASALAFLAGALLPLLTILLTPVDIRIPVTGVAVLIALTITGYVSAKLGESSVPRSILRIVLGGMAALLLTGAVGSLLG